MIAFCGDSFCADYKLISEDNLGWPYLVANKLGMSIASFGIAGSCQYRILKQAEILFEKKSCNIIVICHTSPFRIYAPEHPLRRIDPLHFSSDFVPADTFKKKKYYEKDPYISAARSFYKYLFDDTHQIDIHQLICQRIEYICSKQNIKILHTSGFEYEDFFKFKSFTSISHIVHNYAGSVNHLNQEGNILLAELIYQKINS